METLWQDIRYGCANPSEESWIHSGRRLDPGAGHLVNTYFPQVPKAGLTPGDQFAWRQQNASFPGMGAFTKILQGFRLSGDGEPQQIQ